MPPHATVQHDLHDIWTRRIPVDFVLIWMCQAYTLHQRLGARILHGGIRELRQAELAVQKRPGQAVFHAKLPRQTRLRLVMDEKIAHARTDVADDFTDVVGLQVIHMHQVEHSINGAVCLAAGREYGFTPIPGVMISYGAPKSCTTVSGTNSPSPTKTLKKLKRPSRICGSAVNPRCASCAASTPLRAASPAWSGFVMVPKFCRNPPAFEAAIPSAIWTCGPVNPRMLAAAATAPRVPIAAVGCQPRRRVRGGHSLADFRFNFHPDHKRRDNVLATRTQGLPERQHCWDHEARWDVLADERSRRQSPRHARACHSPGPARAGDV